MERLIWRLRQDGVEVDESLRDEIVALWHWGVERISNPLLREAVVKYYENAVPWQFFVSPSSASGKQHPKHHNRKGGIVRHLAECCVMSDHLMAYFDFEDPETKQPMKEPHDIVLVATIISDTFKNGDPWSPKTNLDHGRIASGYWRHYAVTAGVSEDIIDEVCFATVYHYGRFTPGLFGLAFSELPVYAKIVHLLDVFSSSRLNDIIYTAKDKIEPQNR